MRYTKISFSIARTKGYLIEKQTLSRVYSNYFLAAIASTIIATTNKMRATI